MTEFKFIKYEKHGPVAILTYNRPERLNAVGMEVTLERNQAIADFNADNSLRAIVYTGAGRAFSAGADLKEVAERANRGEDDIMPQSSVEPKKTTIAAVNGIAFGGGFEAALASDLRICSTEARFALPEIKRGFISGSGSWRLQRIISPGIALHYLLTGEEISPDVALRLGIVSKVVEPGELIPEALRLGNLIAENGPLAIKVQTKMWREGAYLPLDRAMAYGRAMAKESLRSEDAAEGARAFAEKRQPIWKGR